MSSGTEPASSTQHLALLPRLAYSGMIMGHCSLELPESITIYCGFECTLPTAAKTEQDTLLAQNG
ncbi:hypothetical protein AAY473_003971 [Plecturocebus cupreus]